MKTNTVVVDRGHLRRLTRQNKGKENTLLDTIGLSAGSKLEEEDGDSEDELAPPQMVKSKITGPPERDMDKRQIGAIETNAQNPMSHVTLS
jgi:hypothetical protein